MQEIIDKAILKLSLALYANPSIPRKAVREILRLFDEFIDDVLFPHLLEKITRNLQIVSDKRVVEIIEMTVGTSKKLFNQYRNEGTAFDLFERYSFYTRPQTFEIGSEKIFEIVDHDTLQEKTRTVTGVYVSLPSTLKKFLEHGDIFEQIMEHLKAIYGNSTVISHIRHGNMCKTKFDLKLTEFAVTLLLFSFSDSFETRNVAGSHSGKQKCTGIYVSLPDLPPHLVAKTSNCFLSTIYNSKDRKICGSKAVFQKLVADMNFLSDHGIMINVGKQIRVYFQPALHTGDNQGLSEDLGFVTSYTSHRFCRICRATRCQCKVMTVEDPELIRTKTSYENDVFINRPFVTGLNENSALNDMRKFHAVENRTLDLLHDLGEGDLPLVMSKVLTHFIKDKDAKAFDLETLNTIISDFPYDCNETNKPQSLKMEYQNGKSVVRIRQSASETFCLFRYLPLMISDQIEEKDEHWDCLISLRKIFDILMAPRFVEADRLGLGSEVEHFLNLYIKLYGDTIPKLHLLLHYMRIMFDNGPPIHFWGMVGERKNKVMKDCISTSKCNKNVPLTIAIRDQLKLCHDLESTHSYDKIIPGQLEKVDKADLEIHPSIISYRYIDIIGKRYQKDSIFVLEVPDDEEPNFGKIHKIYKINEKFYFLSYRVDTSHFDEDHFAYVVEDISPKPNVLINVGLIPCDTPCLMAEVEGTHYVCSRYKI